MTRQAPSANPPPDCALCPRLVGYRAENRTKEPLWHNAPVPSFGALDAELLIVGLAPGVRGANRTGRPFTGDYAGVLLYQTLIKFGFATGQYLENPDDGLHLSNCRLTNAVRCVPPQNLPTPAENKSCNPFLVSEIAAMPRLRAILALGTVAHAMSLRALGARAAAHKFAHGAVHETGAMRLFNSYHVSRYNTNTRRLTPAMFEDVVEKIMGFIK
ncbi:MAG TPA: uracil-DNA glycosylase [Acidocella sp.]|jgi:uracil-DNA glycosylase family 4|uniref:uracil-DNA glycosylase n=1 Tax=Acidocella sp. TaxID=50710 RepID=UPI002B57CFC0|nr:uracil-DNA glycosylase [Acidocella sp.]HVE23654.1 uracil-DNA glycosylase [Acidocella sp.]